MLVNSDPAQAHPSAHALAPLDRHLAAAIDLHRRVKRAQRNMVGRGAAALCETLENVAMALDYCCDLMATHDALLGGAVSGTVQVAAARSFLAGYPLHWADARNHASAVTEAMEAVADAMRDAGAHAAESRDPDTAALLIEVARLIERDLWRIRSAAADKFLRLCVIADGNVDDHPAHRGSHRRFQSPRARFDLMESSGRTVVL